MTTIEAIRVLLPAMIGILIGKSWSAWKTKDERRIYMAFEWAWWVGICLVILAIAAVWPKA